MGIQRFRGKLTYILILMIGISVLGSGLLAADELEKSHIQSLKNSMQREIGIIQATVPWAPEDTLPRQIAYFADHAVHLREHANVRVTFINPEGLVLGDSDREAGPMENHLDRPEVHQALENKQIGSSSRYSSTVNTKMLYVAVPVYNDSEQLIGLIRLSMPLDEIRSYIQGLWIYLIIGLCILFAAAAIISYQVAKDLTRPLDNIIYTARQITQLNYKARVKSAVKGELGQLGHAINNMALSLEQQVERIREKESTLKSVLDNMTIGILMIDKDERIAVMNPSAEEILGSAHQELLGRKIANANQSTELLKLMEESLLKRKTAREEFIFYYPKERLIEANLVPIYSPNGEWGGLLVALYDISDLRRLEMIRSEFVANVSHELKTPIAAVKGFAETLLAGAMNDPELAKSFLQIIYDESGRLDRLIVDILELSKIESKRIPLSFSPVHLVELVRKTMDMMKSEADKKRILLSLHVPEELYIEADEDRLRQILINLLSNGINYSPPGGSVRIEAEIYDRSGVEKIRMKIADTGIGIPKKELSRIFERFYRVDKARSRSSGGTGLGLSIVKHLVELHKGTIYVENGHDVGTVFVIELPVIHA